jgi:hypothetical protein
MYLNEMGILFIKGACVILGLAVGTGEPYSMR